MCLNVLLTCLKMHTARKGFKRGASWVTADTWQCNLQQKEGSQQCWTCLTAV